MSESAPSAPRAEIEAIDLELLALLKRRMGAAEALAAEGGHRVRPAVDVGVMRRLIAAGEGVDPDLIVELWRVLIGAEGRKLGPLDVVVGGGADPVRMHDVARRHFGARTRIHRAQDARAALMRAVEEPNMVAVVPWPASTGAGGWWPALSESKYHRMALIAGLPLRRGEETPPDAALFAQGAPIEAAGGDVTLAMAHDQHHRVQRVLTEAGFNGREIARSEPKVLLQLEGFVAPTDVRVTTLARGGLDGFRVVGSYARV